MQAPPASPKRETRLEWHSPPRLLFLPDAEAAGIVLMDVPGAGWPTEVKVIREGARVRFDRQIAGSGMVPRMILGASICALTFVSIGWFLFTHAPLWMAIAFPIGLLVVTALVVTVLTLVGAHNWKLLRAVSLEELSGGNWRINLHNGQQVTGGLIGVRTEVGRTLLSMYGPQHSDGPESILYVVTQPPDREDPLAVGILRGSSDALAAKLAQVLGVGVLPRRERAQ